MNPSFDNVDLVDYAPVENFGSPELRTTRERLPDVEGEFFQVAPTGAREVVVGGILASFAQTSGELAVADLQARLRSRQSRVGEVATYKGVGAVQYPSSLLISFEQTGAVQVCPTGAGLQAIARVEARVLAQP